MNDDPHDRYYRAIESFLHSLGDYVVLRNHDFRTNLGRGGDVDVLVADMPAARASMANHLGKTWFALRRTYVEGCFYSWGHIDLTPCMEWHGATYIENSKIFAESSVSPQGFRQPRLAHEALICWFASLIWGGFFKERYAPVLAKAAAEDADAFAECLEYAVGKTWERKLLSLLQDGTPEKSAAWAKPLRRALWWQAFKRRPLATCCGWAAYWLREIRLRIKPPLPWVAILGLDGSGKSTVITGIQKKWQEMGLKVTVPHWRPKCIRPGKADGPETNPHGKMPRGLCASTAKLVFLLLDWTLGFRLLLADQRARGWFVIFDRCHHDLLADPIRYRYGAPLWLARIAFRLLPEPDALILLDAPADVLHARKPETTLEMAITLRERYLHIVNNHPRGVLIDCNRPVDTVIDEAASILSRVTEGYKS